ncbi:MAG: hypothetical protein WCJ41_11520 [Aestuariivirga sp.]|uniref:hypothetical protein n=1 Tax=Aestuariivirga sp. TaxID=2650926 RepID=UPI003019D4EF
MSDITSSWRMTLRAVMGPVAVLAAGAALCGAAAAEVTVKPAAKGYDIDITGNATASELIEAIASATGVDIKGEPEDTPVGANHLRNASLERALRALLPKAPFVVKSDDEDMPTEIIFLSPSQNGDGTAGGQDASDPAMTDQDLSDGTAPMTPDPADPMDDGSQDTGQ